ncbi:RcnB family protein, partial [Novosphingobium sp. Chol11]|uniref:RcnB family protein n=1 Tax=Novosphingobium sp. Chol11 TaxID=1385763 RepID=UPI0025EF9690
NRGWNGNRYGFAGNGGFRAWDNGWRRDRRYDWYGWRNSHRNFFRGGFYNAPFRGYSYSRLSIGIFLGSAFYDQRYWINNPWDYHLPDAYGPYRWVRYFNDAILVDTFTGEVVDVITNFDW